MNTFRYEKMCNLLLNQYILLKIIPVTLYLFLMWKFNRFVQKKSWTYRKSYFALTVLVILLKSSWIPLKENIYIREDYRLRFSYDDPRILLSTCLYLAHDDSPRGRTPLSAHLATELFDWCLATCRLGKFHDINIGSVRLEEKLFAEFSRLRFNFVINASVLPSATDRITRASNKV